MWDNRQPINNFLSTLLVMPSKRTQPQNSKDLSLGCSKCENMAFDSIDNLIEHNNQEHKLNGI